MNRPIRVCLVSRIDGACFFYRLKWPMEELVNRGLIEVRGINVEATEVKEAPEKYFSEMAVWAEIFVFQHLDFVDVFTRYSSYSKSIEARQLYVAEMDDNVFSPDPTNTGAYLYYGDEEVRSGDKEFWVDGKETPLVKKEDVKHTGDNDLVFKLHINRVRLLKRYRALHYADVVTTTTPDLASVFTPWNKNVCVLPNYINPNVMPEGKKKPRDYVLIGWQGGDSHYSDLKMVMPALKAVKARYGDRVRFRFMGASFHKLYEEVDGEFMPWVPPSEFYNVFSEDLFDIGIIPLIEPEVSIFNEGKSNIKWLEYSHYSIPSVVSNCTPYKQHIDDGHTGILASTEKSWIRGLYELIDDPIRRFEMGRNAKEDVASKFTIQMNAYQWYNVYKEALELKA